MNQPQSDRTIAIVANEIGDDSSIGSIAAWDAHEALARGWNVIAVCERLDPELSHRVLHVPLFVPPRIHLVKYAAGRATTRWALRDQRPDVVVTHQPQSAAISDVWNVHYLERSALDADRLDVSRGAKAKIKARLRRGVVALEDRYVRRLPPSTRVMFCSDLMRDTFEREYGAPPNQIVVPNPAPVGVDQLAAPDLISRSRLLPGATGPVLGFLGGTDPRKGLDTLLAALELEGNLSAVVAGASLDVPPHPRTAALGYLRDVRDLLDVVDALVVPSRFEPFGLVVVEAAARGVPVIVSPAVGAASLVVEYGAGVLWDGSSPLAPLAHEVTEHRARYAAGGAALTQALDRDRLADRRFAEYELIAERR